MYPVLWETPYFAIHSYGFMLAVGILVCAFLLYKKSPRWGYNPELILEIVIILGLAGVLGARLLFIVLNWSYYSGNWAEIFSLQGGGLSFYGAIILGIGGALLWSRWRKLSFLKVTDFLAPYLLLGYAFGRIGCFLNGCCYGKETDVFWAMPAAFIDNAPRHPVQLYASVGVLLLFFLALYLRKYSYFDGFQLLAVIMLYGFLRFGTEFFRAGEAVWMNLTLAQVVSLLVGVTILAALITGKLLSKPGGKFAGSS